MFIRTAAIYITLILSIIVTLLIMEEYIPPQIQMRINTNISILKFKLYKVYDKLYSREKEYEISVKLEKKKPSKFPVSRLAEYLPLQDNEYINYQEVGNTNSDEGICKINDSKPTIRFTIKEKNVSLKKKIFNKKDQGHVSRNKFFNQYLDLKKTGINKYKTPQMERKMDGNKEYVEMNLKGKLRYVGTNFTNNVIDKIEKLYVDEITTRRTGEPDIIKVTRQPSQGEGYWLKKIRIIGLDNDPNEEKKKNNLSQGNLEDSCSIDESIAIFGGSKVVTSNACKRVDDFRYCESIGYISGSVGETINWYYAEIVDSDMKYANPKAHELSLNLCKQKSKNPESCTIWASMLNGCGVIASSPTGTFSVGYAMNFMKAVNANLNEVFAKQKAMEICEKNDSNRGLCHVSWIRCTATSHREPRRFI